MNLGFYTALSGLQAAQAQLDTASHNIANANTPGYSRQLASQSANHPTPDGAFNSPAGSGPIGTGVSITSIARVRDQFIDTQVHAESAPLGEANINSETLKQVETVFGEPSPNGLSASLQKFFSGWHDLSGDPANTAMRTALRQDGVNLASKFQGINSSLTAMRQDLNDRIGSEVDDINALTTQVADLNKQIKATIAAGKVPSDLLDKQDLLLDKLSKKIAVNVITSPSTGARNVYIGGQPLVNDVDQFNLLPAVTQANGFTSVNYAPSGLPANISGGELKGLIDSRDVTLSPTTAGGVLKEVNDLASSIMATVNAQHSIGFGTTGVTGQTFFDGIDASDIVVNANIVNDTALANGLDVIAAAANDPGSLTGGVGDSQVAINIAQLQNTSIMTGGTATFDGFYKGMITSIATQAQTQTNKTLTQTTLVNSITSRRDQVSGVSTDEEMTNVIRFQSAYAASARVMSTMNSIMDTLMNLGK